MPNTRRKSFSSLAAQKRHCYSQMEKLVAKFGYHTCHDALNKIGTRPTPLAMRAGRPVAFDYGKLMELWHFVEEGRARLGLSVQAFCKGHRYAWFVGGLPSGHPDHDEPFSQIIKGNTLRRRYNQAVALIKSDADLRTHRSSAQDTFPGAQDHSLETIWKQELQRRMMIAAA